MPNIRRVQSIVMMGLIRFVRGDYAWAMQEVMMLAFARNGRMIAKHLIP
jgi:hypothetical protein